MESLSAGSDRSKRSPPTAWRNASRERRGSWFSEMAQLVHVFSSTSSAGKRVFGTQEGQGKDLRAMVIAGSEPAGISREWAESVDSKGLLEALLEADLVVIW